MAAFFSKRKRFGELALEKGLITKPQLDEALKTQREIHQKGIVQKRIGALLLEKGFLDIADINRILEEQQKNALRSWLWSFFNLKHNV